MSTERSGAAARPWLPYAALAGAALVWGLHFVVARGFRAELPPFTLAFWR